MIVGINLLWVKPNKSGGIEAYIRNLLDGIEDIPKNIKKIILLTANDNNETFIKYTKNKKISIIKCNINSERVYERIIWENINLNKFCLKNKINVLFSPVYSIPLCKNKKIKYITTIHDLQALHYPEYFSKTKNIWMKLSWKMALSNSDKIIAISDFVRKDIIESYDVDEKKVVTIYNPISVDNEISHCKKLEEIFNYNEENFFYTIAQILPHKNLKTLLYVISYIKKNKLDLPNKLIISGINGKSINQLNNLIQELDIKENVIFTGFIDNSQRNMLYKKCSIFLFPSIFEGFGMPPIEALMFGARVVTTKCASIPEVTKGIPDFVNDPYDVEEWIKQIKVSLRRNKKIYNFKEYDKIIIANKYLNVISNI